MKRKNYIMFVTLWVASVFLLPFIDIYLFRYFELEGGESFGIVLSQVILMLAWAIVAIVLVAERHIKD
jgi:predicted neutral ceramidase superfamily lipid hydrolase